MAVRIWAVVGVCIIRCECRVMVCGRPSAAVWVLKVQSRAPGEFVQPRLDVPTETRNRVYQQLPPQHSWMKPQPPCGVDHPTVGHIPGRCDKCPRAVRRPSHLCSCSHGQFSTSRGRTDVSVTQGAGSVRASSTVQPHDCCCGADKWCAANHACHVGERQKHLGTSCSMCSKAGSEKS